jgi:uncharacterized protein DUF4238
MLHAYRKSDGQQFPCWPKDVCREWGGDVNDVLQEKSLLGDFRRMVEPYWNESVANAGSGKLSYHDKFVVAMYIAHLMTCTPAWRRVGVSNHNQLLAMHLSFAKKMKEKHGGQPELPVEAIAMIERGELTMDTDPDYIKTLMTKNLMHYAWAIYNQDWILVRSDPTEAFITSDNPVALKYSGTAGEAVHRFLPITPQLCLAIKFDPGTNPGGERLTPQELKIGLQQPPKGTIRYVTGNAELSWFINSYQAQSAEDLVLSSRSSDAVQRLVTQYARFRLDVECIQFPDPAGNEDSFIQGSILRVREVGG